MLTGRYYQVKKQKGQGMKVRRQWLMAAVSLGIMLNPLNSSMIAVALSRLQQVFSIRYTEVSWIIFVFYIASAVAQPVMGRVSDLFGRKRIFLAGLIVASVASVFAPLSPSFGWLLVFRSIQAVGMSMVSSVGMAIVRIHVTEKQASALAVLSIFLSGAAAFGPAIGGILIHTWDWTVIFLINLPIIVASFALAVWVIPQDEQKNSMGHSLTLSKLLQLIDARGILLFSVGLVVLLVGLLSAKKVEFAFIALGGTAILAGFVFYERKASSPLIPLRALVKYPRISLVNFKFIIVNLIYYSVFFGFPSYLQLVRHLNEFDTGVVMLSFGICSLCVSPVAGLWVEKSGPRPALLLSGLLMTMGSLGMVLLNSDSSVLGVCLALSAFGIGGGLNNVGMQTDLFRSSPKERIGVASGMFLTSRYLGTILSSLLLAVIFGDRFSTLGLHLLGTVLAALCLFFIFLSFTFRPSQPPVELPRD
jgi:MFS family permease